MLTVPDAQHVTAVHLTHTDSVANARLQSDEDDFWTASCAWAGCPVRHKPFWSITALADHVRDAHLSHVVDACTSWEDTKSRCRQQLRRERPPLPPPLPTGVMRHFTYPLVLPYRPPRPQVHSSQIMLRKRSRMSAFGFRGPPKLKDLRHAILPARCNPDSDVPFYPIDGEIAISNALNYDVQRSGSIFPLPWWSDSDLPDDELRVRAVYTASEKRQRTAIEVISRPEKERCPPLGVGCQTILDWKVECGKRRKLHRHQCESNNELDDKQQMVNEGERSAQDHVDQAMKGKEKEREMEGPEARFLPDRILRASKRLAARQAGRSFGIKYWEERMVFIKRGVELRQLDE